MIVGGSTHAARDPEVVGRDRDRARRRRAAPPSGVLELEIDTDRNQLHAWRFERVPTRAESRPHAAPRPQRGALANEAR